jgi:hypothetical protein
VYISHATLAAPFCESQVEVSYFSEPLVGIRQTSSFPACHCDHLDLCTCSISLHNDSSIMMIASDGGTADVASLWEKAFNYLDKDLKLGLDATRTYKRDVLVSCG